MTDTRAAFEEWFEADQMGNTEEYYAPKDRAWAAWQASVKHEREACAIMCEVHAAAVINDGKQVASAICHECAAAVRARSQP